MPVLFDRKAVLRYLQNDPEVKNYKQQASWYLSTCLGAVARTAWQRTPEVGDARQQTRVYISNAPRAFKDQVLLPLSIATPLGFMSVDPSSAAPFLLLCGAPSEAHPDNVLLDSSLFENTEVLSAVLPADCIARHRLLKALFLLVTA